jgi:uroporphyrinogen-III synthase
MKDTAEKKSKASNSKKKVKSILISQARPDTDRSPYFELEKKYKVKLTFHPFIVVEGISAKEFRQQKVDLAICTSIIFTSRYAVDHFFRICDESRIKINPELKYYCITEAVALYLQKFTQYRKRKVFFSDDGSLKRLLHVISKNKTKEHFIIPNSDVYRTELCSFLSEQKMTYQEVVLFKTVNNKLDHVLSAQFDMIVLFSPGGVRCLLELEKPFTQGQILIAAFGPSTCKAVTDSKLQLHIAAPTPESPSMVGAIERYLSAQGK